MTRTRMVCAWMATLGLLAAPTFAQQPAKPPAKKPAPAKPGPAKKAPGKKDPAAAKKPAPKPTHAFVGAIVYTGKSGQGAVIPGAVILVGGGKILAVGPKAKVKIPAGVETIDLKGKRVVPGLIDVRSRLFLPAREGSGRDVNDRLVDGLDLFDRRADGALARGVTTVHVGPRGAQFGGQGALVKLVRDGERRGQVAEATQTVTATYVRHGGTASTPAQYLAVYDRYKVRFEQAEDYKEKWDKHAKKLKKYEKDLAAWNVKKAAHDKAMAAYNAAVAAQKKGGAKPAPKKPAPKKDVPKTQAPKKDDPKKQDPPKKDDPKKQDPPEKDDPKKQDPPEKDDPKKQDPPKKDVPKKPVAKKDVPKKPVAKKPAAATKKPAPPKKPAPLAKAPTKPKEPKKDPKLDVLKDLLEGKKPLLVEVGVAEDITSALKLAETFKLILTLTGATEAPAVAAAIGKGKHRVVLGPPAGPDVRDVGLMKRSAGAAAALSGAGITTAISSTGGTARETRYMRYYAIRAMAGGAQPLAALGAVTLSAAKAVGAEKRLGSIETGKDADFVVLDGAFSSLQTHVEAVYIDGKQAYRRTK